MEELYPILTCVKVQILANVKHHHPPLEAGAEVDHGVSIVVTESHGNRAASSGWMMRLVGLLVASE
jgi:hypothetical protein